MREELNEIKKIRVRNNDLWVSVLDIALRHAPEETKAVMAQISRNDRLVADYIKDMVEDIYNEDSQD